MIAPRWRKVARDLLSHKLRTLLVVLSIAVGIFAILVVMGGRGILLQSFDANAAVEGTLHVLGPNPGKNVKGGIVEREASLHASNVQLVCPECGAQTRVGHKILGDGRKVRVCRKCEGVVDK